MLQRRCSHHAHRFVPAPAAAAAAFAAVACLCRAGPPCICSGCGTTSCTSTGALEVLPMLLLLLCGTWRLLRRVCAANTTQLLQPHTATLCLCRLLLLNDRGPVE